jgi:YidC/Oxa1 family membrane protein insertase
MRRLSLKITQRFLVFSVVLIVLGALLTGCNRGPQGIPPYTLEHARQLEAIDPDAAVGTFMAVKNQNASRNPELAAEALWELAQFTSNPNYYGTPAQIHAVDPNHLTPEALHELDEKHTQGDLLARQALIELKRSFANTKVAQNPQVDQLLKVVDERIDRRNSHSLGYKFIDALVALTGRKPDFSYWFALVLLAIIVRALTFPLMLRIYANQREMQRMQPIIREIQARYKDDPQVMFRKVQEAYKEHGVNQFASCLPMLIQYPLLILMFEWIRAYEIHFANGHFLWIGSHLADRFPGIVAHNLAEMDVPLLLIYAASMYLSIKLTPVSDPQMAQQQQTSSLIMTFIMIYFFYQEGWSSAFLLYWLALNLISAAQQYYYIYRPTKLAQAAGGNGAITLKVIGENGKGVARDGQSTSAPSATAPQSAGSSPSRSPSARPAPRPRRKKR